MGLWVPAGSKGISVFAIAVLSSSVPVHCWVTAEFLLIYRETFLGRSLLIQQLYPYPKCTREVLRFMRPLVLV